DGLARLAFDLALAEALARGEPAWRPSGPAPLEHEELLGARPEAFLDELAGLDATPGHELTRLSRARIVEPEPVLALEASPPTLVCRGFPRIELAARALALEDALVLARSEGALDADGARRLP